MNTHHWMIRLRRGDKSVVVHVGLTKTAAEHLADHIIDDDQTEEEVTPLA
jgi:hypothetical protein